MIRPGLRSQAVSFTPSPLCRVQWAKRRESAEPIARDNGEAQPFWEAVCC